MNFAMPYCAKYAVTNGMVHEAKQILKGLYPEAQEKDIHEFLTVFLVTSGLDVSVMETLADCKPVSCTQMRKKCGCASLCGLCPEGGTKYKNAFEDKERLFLALVIQNSEAWSAIKDAYSLSFLSKRAVASVSLLHPNLCSANVVQIYAEISALLFNDTLIHKFSYDKDYHGSNGLSDDALAELKDAVIQSVCSKSGYEQVDISSQVERIIKLLCSYPVGEDALSDVCKFLDERNAKPSDRAVSRRRTKSVSEEKRVDEKALVTAEDNTVLEDTACEETVAETDNSITYTNDKEMSKDDIKDRVSKSCPSIAARTQELAKQMLGDIADAGSYASKRGLTKEERKELLEDISEGIYTKRPDISEFFIDTEIVKYSMQTIPDGVTLISPERISRVQYEAITLPSAKDGKKVIPLELVSLEDKPYFLLYLQSFYMVPVCEELLAMICFLNRSKRHLFICDTPYRLCEQFPFTSLESVRLMWKMYGKRQYKESLSISGILYDCLNIVPIKGEELIFAMPLYERVRQMMGYNLDYQEANSVALCFGRVYDKGGLFTLNTSMELVGFANPLPVFEEPYSCLKLFFHDTDEKQMEGILRGICSLILSPQYQEAGVAPYYYSAVEKVINLRYHSVFHESMEMAVHMSFTEIAKNAGVKKPHISMTRILKSEK